MHFPSFANSPVGIPHLPHDEEIQKEIGELFESYNDAQHLGIVPGKLYIQPTPLWRDGDLLGPFSSWEDAAFGRTYRAQVEGKIGGTHDKQPIWLAIMACYYCSSKIFIDPETVVLHIHKLSGTKYYTGITPQKHTLVFYHIPQSFSIGKKIVEDTTMSIYQVLHG